jgi:nitrate reductase beta subunit
LDGISLAAGLSWCNTWEERDEYLKGWRLAFAGKLIEHMGIKDCPQWAYDLVLKKGEP